MNWRLVFIISLFGLLMAIANIYFITTATEPFVWLLFYLISAYFIAKYADENYFLNGLFVGIISSVWVILADMLLFGTYYTHHRDEVSFISNLGITGSVHNSLMIFAPVAGLLSGCVIGLLAWLASKIVKPKVE